MNKRTAVAFVMGIVMCACLGAMAPQRYWQDVIHKPNQGWRQVYDRDMPEANALAVAMDRFSGAIAKNDSQLACNDAIQNQAIKSMGLELIEIRKRLAVLEVEPEVVDPNSKGE